MNHKTEQLRFIIGRFDHYYDGVNTKSSFYLGLNTFIIGGLTAGYYQFAQKIHFCCCEKTLFLLSILCGFVSIASTLLAILPFLNSGNVEKGYRSLVFFGSVAGHKLNEFESEFSQQTLDTIEADLIKQTHVLAGGLKTKFTCLKIAGVFIAVEFLLLIPILFSIFQTI